MVFSFTRKLEVSREDITSRAVIAYPSSSVVYQPVCFRPECKCIIRGSEHIFRITDISGFSARERMVESEVRGKRCRGGLAPERSVIMKMIETSGIVIGFFANAHFV